MANAPTYRDPQQNLAYGVNPYVNAAGSQVPDAGFDLGYPSYLQSFDPATMSLAPELAARLQGLNLNTQGLDQYRQEALRKTASPWANLSNAKQYAQEKAAHDQAVSQARSSGRQAESDLAASGGLSSGARERIARKTSSDLIGMSQDVSRQGNLNRMQIGVNDEQNRIQRLAQLPGMENANLNSLLQKENVWDTARNSDIQRITDENNRRNQFNQNLYNQKMTAWAADRQAQATQNSGKK